TEMADGSRQAALRVTRRRESTYTDHTDWNVTRICENRRNLWIYFFVYSVAVGSIATDGGSFFMLAATASACRIARSTFSPRNFFTSSSRPPRETRFDGSAADLDHAS